MNIRCRVPLRVDLAGGWSDIPPFARREGGAVLNVAISQYVTGEVRRGRDGDDETLRICYGLDLPAGAGLGSSAALSVAWLALVQANMGRELDRNSLAKSACELGAVIGILGGKQDEYAAAIGGVNLMRFHEGVSVEPVELDQAVRGELESRLVLCYSGRSRLSGDIHDRVWGAYELGDTVVGANLAELREVAVAMRDALVAGDFETVADLMNRNWEAQKRLHASVTNASTENLFSVARQAGATAGKACGAGGGGCVVFLVPPSRADPVRMVLRDAGARLIDAGIDWDGVVLS